MLCYGDIPPEKKNCNKLYVMGVNKGDNLMHTMHIACHHIICTLKCNF